MSKFKKIASIMIMIEILCVIFCNVLYVARIGDATKRLYRVEAKRIALKLQEVSPEDIDLSDYRTITAIQLFDATEICNHDYVIEEVNGKLYRIEYQATKNNNAIWIFNVGMSVLLFISIGVFFYIWKRVLSPFHKMSDLTYQLAKGNLSTPLKAERSKFFGRFLWGMDMLRESLEDGRQKELELQKEKKTLILSLSHDIKTPLSAIDMYTKALQKNLYESQEKKEEVLEGILNNVQEIKGYVDKIVTASREDFLNLEVHNGEFYLLQFLSAVETYYKDKLAVLHTAFIIENAKDCMLHGDRDRMIEVLQNVIENAIKYGDGRQIRIFTSDEEDCKLIHIENTGNDLKAEEIANIFDSFYRGSNCQNVKGSGLGLYIAKSLMKKMDGDIYAQAEEEKFCVTLVIRKA